MSIIKPSEKTQPVFSPKSNYPIAKYMDLTKFISLLSLKSLFFCRLDKLEDHYEGTTSKPNFEKRKEIYRKHSKRFPHSKPFTEEEIDKNVKSQYEMDNKLKSLNCVCCWNKYKDESAALWKIYSDFQKGIMIISNINKLTSSLINTTENLNLSEIKYIDYNKDYMPDRNIIYPIIHKHKAYQFEEEVRIIHTVNHKSDWSFDWEKQENENGKYIKVDINELISEVIVSPYASTWYIELIKDLCDKFGLKKEIKKASLAR